MSEYMNIHEICDLFGVSRSTIDRRVKNRTFPQPFRIGKTLRWTRKSVMSYKAKKDALCNDYQFRAVE